MLRVGVLLPDSDSNSPRFKSGQNKYREIIPTFNIERETLLRNLELILHASYSGSSRSCLALAKSDSALARSLFFW